VLQRKKISFRYFNHGIDKKKVYRNDGKPYIVSPYTMACSNNNYYLIAFHEKYDDYSQFRLDRMERIAIIAAPRRELPNGFKIEKYIQKVFSMYNGELKEIEIVFDNSLINAAVDRFGKNALFTKVDDEHFAVRATLSISPTFFSWLFQFGDKVTLTAPQDVKDELKAHAEKFMSNL
jgi:predicted DNA-binding transcriptional regulator YafY